MRSFEESVLKKELGRYKYLLWKVNGKYIKNKDINKLNFYKQKIKEYNVELKALGYGR